MGDPLSVAASIIGIIAAAGKVAETLGPLISNVKDTKNIVRTIQTQVKDSRSILQALQRLFDDLEQSPRRRKKLIQIDQLRATLLDGTVIFSDLEPVVLQLGTANESLRNRVQWARKRDQLETFVSRLELFKSSITVMLNILQCESDLDAMTKRQELYDLTSQLLQSNRDLSRRLSLLESRPRDDSNSTLSQTSPRTSLMSIRSQIRAFEFERDLKESWVYRKARRSTADVSFRSSTALSHAWSALSDISLSDISAISVVALPISSNDLSNGHYYRQDPGTLAGSGSQQASLWDPRARISMPPRPPRHHLMPIEQAARVDKDENSWVPRVKSDGWISVYYFNPLTGGYSLWDPRPPIIDEASILTPQVTRDGTLVYYNRATKILTNELPPYILPTAKQFLEDSATKLLGLVLAENNAIGGSPRVSPAEETFDERFYVPSVSESESESERPASLSPRALTADKPLLGDGSQISPAERALKDPPSTPSSSEPAIRELSGSRYFSDPPGIRLPPAPLSPHALNADKPLPMLPPPFSALSHSSPFTEQNFTADRFVLELEDSDNPMPPSESSEAPQQGTDAALESIGDMWRESEEDGPKPATPTKLSSTEVSSNVSLVISPTVSEAEEAQRPKQKRKKKKSLQTEEEEAPFWIPQDTPNGRLFYFNTLTGDSTLEPPSTKPRYPREYKLVVMGGGGADKSDIIPQLIQPHSIGQYHLSIEDSYHLGIGDSYRQHCVIDDELALLDVLDTAGQEEYLAIRTMREQYMRTAEGFMIVYSITNRVSFEEALYFYQQLLRVKDKYYFPMILVGNHCEREGERQVSVEEGQKRARQFGCPFMEVSAGWRINIDKAFYDLVHEVRRYDRSIYSPKVEDTPSATTVTPETKLVKRRQSRDWLKRTRRNPSMEAIEEVQKITTPTTQRSPRTSTPVSRESQHSRGSSSKGRSVQTISSPIIAENSLGWL